METQAHDLSHSFLQLGLPHLPDEIEHFIATHPLPAGLSLAEAPYWSPAQAAFLRQALSEDADWAEAVDSLAVRLR